tara:strand:+ start:1351 stop:2022 length:672 start_codon:yes stop_codon:yes gene_type:complete
MQVFHTRPQAVDLKMTTDGTEFVINNKCTLCIASNDKDFCHLARKAIEYSCPVVVYARAPISPTLVEHATECVEIPASPKKPKVPTVPQIKPTDMERVKRIKRLKRLLKNHTHTIDDAHNLLLPVFPKQNKRTKWLAANGFETRITYVHPNPKKLSDKSKIIQKLLLTSTDPQTTLSAVGIKYKNKNNMEKGLKKQGFERQEIVSYAGDETSSGESKRESKRW